MNIYLDESGYTGPDLINEDQPFFVLASLGSKEDRWDEIKAQHFPGVLSNELKHSSLRKSASRQRMVAEFISFLGENPNFLKISVANKKYVAISKLVDLIIVEAFHWNGHDLLENGRNIIFSNRIYWGLKIAGQAVLDKVVSSFQEFVRAPTGDSMNELIKTLEAVRYTKWIEQDLAFALVACEKYGNLFIQQVDGESLDLAMTTALTLMGLWRGQTEHPLDAIHDESKNMSQRADIWGKLTDPTIEPVEVGYDRRKMKFPVALRSTTFAKSDQYSGLQLADVVSGSLGYLFKVNERQLQENDHYWKLLAQAYEPINIDNPLNPFIGFTPEQVSAEGGPIGDLFDVVEGLLSS